VLLAAAPSEADVYYVDAGANAVTHDGSSWCAAFTNLDGALAVAGSGDLIAVAGGIYVPPATENYINSSFVVPSGVAIFGGFAGCGASNPNDRDVVLYETVLSGDHQGDDEPLSGSYNPTRFDNSTHVLVADGADDTTVLDGLTISNGNADNGGDAGLFGDAGGGIYMTGSDIRITNCRFTQSYALQSGGAVFSENGDPTFDHCTFENNLAQSGGAIYDSAGTLLALTDCTFTANGQPILVPTNTAGEIPGEGGAVASLSTTVVATRCRFERNGSPNGGGIYGTGGVEATNCDFVQNYAASTGGAISASEGLTVRHCTFDSNVSEVYYTGQGGGAIQLWSGTANIQDSSFTSNTTTGDGGAIFLTEGTGHEIQRCTFSANQSKQTEGASGGALWLAGDGQVVDCTFEQNSALYNGGAVITSGGPWRFERCAFENNLLQSINTSILGGGAIGAMAETTIDRCRFYENNAGRNGAIGAAAPLTVVSSMIVGNQSTYGGGAIGADDDLTMINCTIAENTIGEGVGGVDHGGGALRVESSIFWNNEGLGSVEDAQLSTNDPTPVVGFSCIQGLDTFAGPGNIGDDPQFVIVANQAYLGDDYLLSETSPCIDAGNGVADCSSLRDLAGNPRHIDVASVDGPYPTDIGAFEFVPAECANDPETCGSGDCNGNDSSDVCDIDGGLANDCNANWVPDVCETLTGTGEDCNGNGQLDSCDVVQLQAALDEVRFTNKFRVEPGLETYQNMIAAYGTPWPPCDDPQVDGCEPRTPSLDESADPASKLRALVDARGCPTFEPIYRDAAHELSSMEMLLGNEAYADAMDPTVGLDGISVDAVGDLFAFQGAPGTPSLIEEELALLRGRDLIDLCAPGDPDCLSIQWDDAVDYPAYTDGKNTVRAAIYNRLAPNADGPTSIAYQSNYNVSSNYDAAATGYPQGQGDAYGYYLTAIKSYLAAFRGAQGNPDRPGDDDFAAVLIDDLQNSNPPFGPVLDMVSAMAARARTVLRIVDLTFRRDYRESTSDPSVERLFADVDAPKRAWSMLDWSRRGAMGVYLDWAVAAHHLPTGGPREGADALGELAATARELQERVDTAGAGMNPLGLVQNVVPFGINAGQLANFIEDGSGKSHYDQVRNAAAHALSNARTILQWANQAAQRLREQSQDQSTFSQHVLDRSFDFNNRLLELFGYASIDDPYDNDFDPTTDDREESEHADLVNFMFTDEQLAQRGWRPRSAPGEIQIALSELRAAKLVGDQAIAEVDAHRAEITDLMNFITFRQNKAAEQIRIINQAGEELSGLVDRLEELETACDTWCQIKKAMGPVASAAECGFTGDISSCVDAATQVVDYGFYVASSVQGTEASDSTYDIERERVRINTWKEAELAGIDNDIAIEEERLKLRSLIRETPQLLVNVDIAQERAQQAFGRLNIAIQRGKRLVEQRKQVDKVLANQLEALRWKDASYRVFRNNALQKYSAFFDLASRYVQLAARAFAYEYNDRDFVDSMLEGVHRELRLGNEVGTTGGLNGVIAALDGQAVTNQFNSPFTSTGTRTFSVRRNLLGLSSDNDGRRAFRDWVDGKVVQRLQDLAPMRDLAQLVPDRDFGPAIVIPFSTEVASANFFGQGPDLPFGGDNFPQSRNVKILKYAVRFTGIDPEELGIFDPGAYLSIYFLPIGESILRENTNLPILDDTPRAWAAIDQYLPVPPPIAIDTTVTAPDYNPWVSTAQSNGNYLNAIKRFIESEAQILTGDPTQQLVLNTDRAGRSAWNSEWLLVVPGGQFTNSGNPDTIRDRLGVFINGADGDPTSDTGLTDIQLVMEAYRN